MSEKSSSFAADLMHMTCCNQVSIYIHIAPYLPPDEFEGVGFRD
jgi:hypothetical protein